MGSEGRRSAGQKEAGTETEDGGFLPCLLNHLDEADCIAGDGTDRAELFRVAMSAREPLQMTPDDAAKYPLHCRVRGPDCPAACELRLGSAAVTVTVEPGMPSLEDACLANQPFEE